MQRFIVVLFVLLCAGCAGGGGGAMPTNAPAQTAPSGFKIPAKISAAVPPAPPAMTPPKPSSLTRRTSSGSAHPAFFAGETALANGVYYLTLPNGNVFGYYSYLSDPNYIYHFDMGFEYMTDANDGQGGIYFYDSPSGHWWYTSRSYEFPYLYDFTLNAILYYYPDTQNAGHYTTNPRYFYNFATSKVITLPGTVVWQTGGSGNLGQYTLVDSSNGQCAGVGPVINGSNASFTVTRNTSSTTYSGGSTCYRNQMSPMDPNNTSSNFLLTMGAHYTYYFQTVVTLNGNYLYQGAADGGIAADIPAIVWQTHSYGGSGQPCDLLVIQNTYKAYTAGSTQYGNPVAQGGLPTWNFHTCDESDFTGNAYNSADTLHDGEVDNWQIDTIAQIQGQSGGTVTVRRNGTVVYNAASHVCDSSTTECWWNFGPYMFYWQTTEEPPGWNSAGVTIQVNKMTLVQQ
jgi:hypothetical protein